MPVYESITVQTKQMARIKECGIYTEANVDCQGKSRRTFAHDRGHERSSRGRSGQEQAHFLPMIAGN